VPRSTPVRDGLSTQVPIGIDEGLKHESSIHCDELVSLPKSSLTDYIGVLSGKRPSGRLPFPGASPRQRLIESREGAHRLVHGSGIWEAHC